MTCFPRRLRLPDDLIEHLFRVFRFVDLVMDIGSQES